MIHVKSPSLGGGLPNFDLISLLNIHLPPRRGNSPENFLFLGLISNPSFFPMKKSTRIFKWKCIVCLSLSIKWNVKGICIICQKSHRSIKGGNVTLIHPDKNFSKIWTFLTKKCCEIASSKISLLDKMKGGISPSLNFSNLTCMQFYFTTINYNWSILLTCTSSKVLGARIIMYVHCTLMGSDSIAHISVVWYLSASSNFSLYFKSTGINFKVLPQKK